MHHLRVDALASGAGPLHLLDPRAKLLVALAMVLGIVLAAGVEAAALYGAVVVGAVLVAGVPPAYMLRRLLLVLPLAAMLALALPLTRPGRELMALGPLTVTLEGCREAALLVFKALLAASVTLLLVCTTRFNDLLRGLRSFGVPSVMLQVLSFLYRYLFVLVEEGARMKRAAQARNPGRGGRGDLRLAAALLGSLFLRTYDRAERIHRAMLARGYDGDVRGRSSGRFRAADAVFVALGLTVALLVSLGAGC